MNMHPNVVAGAARRQRARLLFLLLAVLAGLPIWAQPAASASAEAARLQGDVQYAALAAPALASAPATTLAQTAQQAPAEAIPAPSTVSQGTQRYFSQTAHFLRGAFLTYWQTHGATPVLGLPITEPIVEDGLAVQYLERARLEYHPEIADPRGRVLLTRLGVIMSEVRGLQFTSIPLGGDTPTSVYFPQTGHNLANAFLSYWQRNGGLAVFGYPISEEFVEISPTDGQPYTVQYFERNRFEWHPERSPQFNVQLGLLGVEYAKYENLDPLARVMLPAPLPLADGNLSDDPRLAELVESDLLPAIQALGRTPQFQWVPAVLIENRGGVEFSEIGEEGIAGAFIATRSRSQPYLIVVPERYRGSSTEALASVLAHEATHAFNFTTGVMGRQRGCSVEEELRAYLNALASWVLLKGTAALTERFAPTSFDAAVSRSLRGFYGDKTQLDFDFDIDTARAYLQDLYGPDCGS
jgi:hypothetical protein